MRSVESFAAQFVLKGMAKHGQQPLPNLLVFEDEMFFVDHLKHVEKVMRQPFCSKYKQLRFDEQLLEVDIKFAGSAFKQLHKKQRRPTDLSPQVAEALKMMQLPELPHKKKSF